MGSFAFDEVFTIQWTPEELNQPGFLQKLANENVPFEIFYFFCGKGLDFESFSEDEQSEFVTKIAISGDVFILKYLIETLEKLSPSVLTKYFDSTSAYGKYFISGKPIGDYDYNSIRSLRPDEEGINAIDKVYEDRFYKTFYDENEWSEVPRSYSVAYRFVPADESAPHTSGEEFLDALFYLSTEFTRERLDFFRENYLPEGEVPKISPEGIEISFPLAVIITKTIPNMDSIKWIKKALEDRSPSAATLFLETYHPDFNYLFSELVRDWTLREYPSILFNWAIENFSKPRYLVGLFFSGLHDVDFSIQRALRDKVYLDYKNGWLEQILVGFLYDRYARIQLALPEDLDSFDGWLIVENIERSLADSILERMFNYSYPEELGFEVVNMPEEPEMEQSTLEEEPEMEQSTLEEELSKTDFSNAVNEVLPENIDEDPLTYEPFGEYYFKCENSFPHYFDADNYIKFCRHSLQDPENVGCSICPLDKTFGINPQVFRNSTGILPTRVYDVPLRGIIYFSLFLVEITHSRGDKYFSTFLPSNELRFEGKIFRKNDQIVFTVKKINQLFEIRISSPHDIKLISEITLL